MLNRIRAGWVFGGSYTPDFAIAKTRKPIKFIEGVVSPVCLPTHDDGMSMPPKDEHPQVYVAGWGATSSQCDSNNDGPAKHRMCKFPFVHNGRTIHACSNQPTPSASDPICKEFFDWSKTNGVNLGEKLSDSFSILYWKKNKVHNTICYHSRPGEHGWCGTCYDGVEEQGKEGYCDPYQGNTKEMPPKSEFSKPTTDENWGWCTPWCKNSQTSTKELMETRLSILNKDECDLLGDSLKANSTMEICAGKINKFPKVKTFIRKKLKKSKKITFKEHSENVDYLGVTKFQKFYVGGTDSCQGT